jgi:hypothetical protein
MIFFDTEDLVVIVTDDETGIETLLVENTDYTVSGGAGSTGTVSLAGGSSPHGALLNETTLTIAREVSAVQEADLVNNDGSDSEVLERALDRLTVLTQQYITGLARSLRQTEGDVDDITALPSVVSRASKLLGFDADGNPFVYALADATINEAEDFTVRISTDTAAFRMYRADATFNGTVNHATLLGYNSTGFGQIADSSKAAIMFGFEPDYNDGSAHYAEFHSNIAGIGESYVRPFAAYYALTGGEAGLLINTNLFADININFFAEHVRVEAAPSLMIGAQFHLISLDTGGKDWNICSTGSAAAVGAGSLLFYNDTDDTTGMVLRGQNLAIGGGFTFGTNAVGVLAMSTGTAPTTGPADTVQFYSTDNSAGHTIPSFFCEGTEVLATGQADSVSSVRVKMRINGTVVTMLAI